VSHRWKPIVACLGLVLLATAGGCGSSTGEGSKSPATAVNDPNTTPTTASSTTTTPPKPAPDTQHPVVVIETSLGDITVELDRKKALLTVDNFLHYVRDSFYDQTIIHRVDKGKGILGGGYNTKLVAKPVRTPIYNEADNGLKNARGTIAMIRQPDAIHSATSQFFINVGENPSLDYKARTPEGYGYCVFGKVTDGMDVVDKINAVQLRDTPEIERTPVEPVIVKSIRRIR
jgi:cyclophilin family peptidyl-prolyl cis-trans isomerase